MSERTRRALERAVARHFSDEKGAHYSDFVIAISGVCLDLDQDRARAVYSIEHSENIAPHVMLGLGEMLRGNTVTPVVDYEAEKLDYGDED